MFRLALAGLLLGAFVPPAVRADDDPFAGRPTLERAELIAAVLARNPSLEAARLAHVAALARPAQARSLADPGLRYEVAPLSIGADVPFGHRLAVEQELPYPGKRRLRGEAAAAEAEGAGREAETLRLDLALGASLLYDDYVLVARALEVNAEHARLVRGFLDVATARYAAGLLPQQDPLQAEVELAHLEHDRLTFERQRDEIVARLDALLHREPGASLPPPAAAAPPSSPPAEDLAAVEALEAEALAARPELTAAEAEIRALEAGTGLAKLERRPDFGVMASYDSMWMDGEHRWMAGVSLALPIRGERLRAVAAEAEARLAAAASRRDALVDAVRAEVRQAHLRLHEAHHVLDLYHARLLPASRDQVAAARAGVETGGTSFLALIDAERNLRRVELGYHEAIADFHRRRAELDRSLGRLPGARP